MGIQILKSNLKLDGKAEMSEGFLFTQWAPHRGIRYKHAFDLHGVLRIHNHFAPAVRLALVEGAGLPRVFHRAEDLDRRAYPQPLS